MTTATETNLDAYRKVAWAAVEVAAAHLHRNPACEYVTLNEKEAADTLRACLTEYEATS